MLLALMLACTEVGLYGVKYITDTSATIDSADVQPEPSGEPSTEPSVEPSSEPSSELDGTVGLVV